MLFCLGDKSDRGAFFRGAERYVINILGAEGEPLAARYARPGETPDRAGGRRGACVGAPRHPVAP